MSVSISPATLSSSECLNAKDEKGSGYCSQWARLGEVPRHEISGAPSGQVRTQKKKKKHLLNDFILKSLAKSLHKYLLKKKDFEKIGVGI